MAGNGVNRAAGWVALAVMLVPYLMKLHIGNNVILFHF